MTFFDRSESAPTEHPASKVRSALSTHASLRSRGLPLAAALFAVAVAGAFAYPQFMPSASSQVQFADPAFRTTWERTDGPVASTAVERGCDVDQQRNLAKSVTVE